jgi:hypothetical protein
MTLIVHAYRRDPATSATHDLDERPVGPRNDLAGFESWRTTVWGSAVVIGLGATVLPSLATGDIHAEGAELDQLASELAILIANVARVASVTGVDEFSLRFRLDNIVEAVRLARSAGRCGGVYIG